ncbi:tyrosinase precursor [Tricladium varicosporioides]|nr:tyrosinase precursor [Hymenoscyphus varicosporioides]
MAALNHPVIGAPKLSPAPADGSVPLRLEIRELQNKHADQWNLYLLGLDAFKKVDEKSDLSYYGIAGIHGRPYRPWGGVKGTNNPGWQGYCTHTSILFASWHRPYLALFEQTLYAIIQNVASQFPAETKARYQQAAVTFRIPYWDWAATPPNGDSYFPNSVGAPTINVITPQSGGKSVSIPNPLYSFNFKPLNPVANDFVEQPFRTWPNTLRYPTSTRSPTAVSNEQQVFAAMESQFPSLQGNVNILMNDPNYKDFAAFSNHAWQNNDPSTFASIEDIHNSIHGDVGGNMGHMSELDYSSFDPVFWLHHCNVDRLFAIWQALNPTNYTINKRDQSGTFVITRNTAVTATTPLAPFADASGTKYWTSEGARQTTTFNYAYPETRRWAFKTDEAYRASVQGTVQQLYGGLAMDFAQAQGLNLATLSASLPEATSIKAKVENSPTVKPAEQSPAPAAASSTPAASTAAAPHHGGSHMLSNIVSHIKDAIPGHHKENTDGARGLDLEAEIGKPSSNPVPATPGEFTEYIVNVKVPKHVLAQTFRVHVFLGPFDSATNTWCTQDALVGAVTVFGKEAETTGCGKCKEDAEENVVITGTVPLTAALMKEYKKGSLGALSKENVLPWLRENLHWRVTVADGTEQLRQEVPGLRVSVVTTQVALPVGGYPQYSGVYELHPEVTDGRPAGYNFD